MLFDLGGIVTVTPSGDPNAETYLNGQRIRDTTILQHGAVLKLGAAQVPPGGDGRGGLQGHTFRFVDPSVAAYPPAMQNPQPQANRVSTEFFSMIHVIIILFITINIHLIPFPRVDGRSNGSSSSLC